MSKSGELLHIDLHHLASGITICNNNQVYYLLGLIDGYSRLSWVEVLESKRALDVMFATLKAFNILHFRYGIDVAAVMSDNGSEFGGGRYSRTKSSHPFERLLL